MSRKSLNKTNSFCVAVDGSSLSHSALRLALALMRSPADTLLVVHAVNEDTDRVAGKDITRLDETSLLKMAQLEALKLRVRPEQVSAETVSLGARTIVQALASAANTRSKVFVVGASGRGQEMRNGSKPLGSVAEGLLSSVRVPMVLMRTARGAKFQLRAPDELSPLEPRPPITFGVAVDRSTIAKRAFDQAMLFATPRDTVRVVHAHASLDGAARAELNALQPLYDAECAKATALRAVKECKLDVLATTQRETIQSKIADFCESAEIDLLILGSIELADPSNGLHLGSVAAACAKMTHTNVCIIKNVA